jgi:hypothetical protein
MVLYLVTSIYGAMFIHNAATFGVALVAHTVLSGTYFTCAASLPQVLLPRTKYSQYASANGILVQLIGLMYGPAIGEILDLTHNSYRLTFWAGLILSFLTLVFMVLVYIRFRQYGGTKGYVAPGDEAPATPHEPPKHLISTILLYLAGALIGAAGGYLASFVFQRHEAVPLGQYPALLLRNKDVRDLALFIIATGVLPGAVLGAVFATRWNKRKSA